MTLRNVTLTAVAALSLGTAMALAQTATTETTPVVPPATTVAPETTTAPATTAAPEATTAPEATAPAAETAPTTETAPADADAIEAAPAAEEPATEEAAPDATAEEPAAEAAPAEEAAEEAPAEEAAAEEPAAEEAAAEEAPAEEATAEEPAAEEPAAEEAPAAAEEAATDEAAADEAPAEEAAAEEAPAEEPAAEAAAEDHAAAEGAEEHAEAASHDAHVTDVAFSFEGPFGKYDQFQLQRGLQVYTEVCAACHGMRYVPLRTLHDEGGPGLPEDQVRAYAAQMSILDAETGEERPRVPTDHFPTVSGEGMGPDLSTMAKARAGFHGPYGTGLSQLFNGIGGPEYIYSVLTGYTGEDMEQAGSVLYENTAFPGGYIGMPAPLSDDLVTYEDGTPATVDQMSRDVAAFLMWTAEPKMSDRKTVGLVAVLFLILLTVLLYLTNKKLWAPHKRH